MTGTRYPCGTDAILRGGVGLPRGTARGRRAPSSGMAPHAPTVETVWSGSWSNCTGVLDAGKFEVFSLHAERQVLN
jgi:hypothetical protein